MTELHFVVPDGIEDPARPSGGNVYDRHVRDGLRALGWAVREHRVPGHWPRPDHAASAALADAVGRIPERGLVLLDGLIASAAPGVLVPQAARLRLVVLVHMPLGHRPTDEDARASERAVLSTAGAVVTTSAWSARRLRELYELEADRVHVAEPGVDPAEPAGGTEGAGSLLCVAAVTFGKGHDVLLSALETISELAWRCVCVGSLEREPEFVESLRGRSDRVEFLGPRTGADLDRLYASADVLVLASRAETYGMVVIEALARGLPVIASDVGGVSEALGFGADGERPGVLVRAENPGALAGALRTWLIDAELRQRLRRAARERRDSLPPWSMTASRIAEVLDGMPR